MEDEHDVVRTAEGPVGARIRTLVQGDHRRNRSEIIIENEANILAAAEAGVELLHLYVSPRLEASDVVGNLSPGVLTSVITDEVLAELFQETRVPQIFATARIPTRQRFRAFAKTSGDLVVLDSLDGPGNIGSIIRVAAAFEAGGVVFLDQHIADVYRRGIVRASAGTMFKLPLVTSTTEKFIQFCQASGTPIVTTSSHAPGGFDEVAACPDRLAVVFGSETHGCSVDLAAVAAVQCRIPMSPRVESLNVSAAASVLLFARSPARRSSANWVGDST